MKNYARDIGGIRHVHDARGSCVRVLRAVSELSPVLTLSSLASVWRRCKLTIVKEGLQLLSFLSSKTFISLFFLSNDDDDDIYANLKHEHVERLANKRSCNFSLSFL